MISNLNRHKRDMCQKYEEMVSLMINSVWLEKPCFCLFHVNHTLVNPKACGSSMMASANAIKNRTSLENKHEFQPNLARQNNNAARSFSRICL